MKTDSGHIGYIESLRAFAALGVVLFHFVNYHNGESYIVKHEGVRNFAEFGSQGVELFFLISGFVIMYSLDRNAYTLFDYPRYLLKRFLRIMPVYWMTILATLIVGKFLAWLWGYAQPLDWHNIVANMFFTVDLYDGCSWLNVIFVTLGVEFQFYLVIALLYPLIRKNVLFKYGIFILWLAAGVLTKTHYTFLLNAPFFILGMLLLDITREGQRAESWTAILLILILLGWQYNWEDIYVALIGIVAFVWIKPNWKLTNWIGHSSYSLYLMHGLVGGNILFFLSHPKQGGLSDWWIILPTLVVCIVLCWIFYLVVEKPAVWASKSVSMKANKAKSPRKEAEG
jgi:peptidoglycan/LPS O-acetylase OafA/YrhL